ncbi:MAG: ATP-dependent zinc metalloprotease FtsH [Candidatus Nomurabacteria bacterium]|jgi:cell division protease FtsH|nr:ATP-dependent zinc metalloprotease FtsH [Candidatus Nomurabacteria bacterium]
MPTYTPDKKDNKSKSAPKKPSKNSNAARNVFFWLLVAAMIIGISSLWRGTEGPQKLTEVPISEVIRRANAGEVKKIEIIGQEVKITPKDSDKPTEVSRKEAGSSIFEQGLNADSTEVVITEPSQMGEILWSLLSIGLPIVAIGFLFFFMVKQMNAGNSQAMGFGKANAKIYDDSKKVKFADIAGNENAKQDLLEVVDFLKNPKKYEALGAKIPTGLLLAGDPGTGKTLMARAVAGEAGVPFFSISGSEFAEMFVGVGASRVRDLFSKARKNSPSIIFIDEIDAVAHKRDARGGAGREDEQTLNQILVEMDGFDGKTGVIVIAATNRIDMLDKALLRPGRFDRHINVQLPERKDREEILEVHFKNKPHGKVDIKSLAAKTTGLSGADLANIANEAAIIAARDGKKEIENREVVEAFEKVAIGPERKNKAMNEKERELTAYHEAGHAVVGFVLPDSDTVHKVTVIPRGRTGGVTWFLPPEDRSYKSIYEFKDVMARAMGGRIAESLIYGADAVTTGAGADLKHVAEIARAMVIEEGMSKKLRNRVFPEVDSGWLGGKKYEYSEVTAREIDEEVEALTTEATKRAEAVLKANLPALKALAAELLKKETLEEDEVKAILEPATKLPDSAKLH